MKKNLKNILSISSFALGLILMIAKNVIENRMLLKDLDPSIWIEFMTVVGLLLLIGGLYTWLVGKVEKHDLFKITGVGILVTIVLTWIIKSGGFSGTDIVISEIKRIGLNDAFTYSLLSVYFFAIIVSLFLIIGGFYEILSLTSGYQHLITRLTKFLKGKEIPFVLITSFLVAVITSISNEFYQILVFMPLIITLVLNLTKDKIIAFSATFGSILIGIIGSTYSSAIFQELNQYLSATYTTQIFIKVLLFSVTYILFNFFAVMRLLKLETKKEKLVETKETKKITKKEVVGKVWPIVIVLAVLLLFQIIGYISWKAAFNVTIFDDFHNWLIGLSIEDTPIVSNILGTSSSFGNWDLYIIQMLLLIASGILALIYKIKFDDLIKAFAEGAKKMLKPILIMLMIYAICIFTVKYSVIPTVVDAITGLSRNFNVYLTSLSAFIASIFGVEMRYIASSIVSFFGTAFGTDVTKPIILSVFQAMYGFVQFFAPTSLFLMIGLSYLDIKYKDWIKYIWMFLVGLFVIIVIILTLITYVL